MIRLRSAVLLVVAPLLLAACVTTSRSRQVTGEEVVVEVHNDVVPRRSLTIRAVDGTGRKVLLGTVLPGQTRTLDLRLTSIQGQYRLLAEAGRAGRVASVPFSLVPNVRVTWYIRNNTIRVSDPV